MARTTLFQAANSQPSLSRRFKGPSLSRFRVTGGSSVRLAPPHPPFKRRIRSTASQRAVYPRKTDECLPSSGPNFPVDSLAAATTKLHGNSINSIRETRVQFEISTPVFQTKWILLMDEFFFKFEDLFLKLKDRGFNGGEELLRASSKLFPVLGSLCKTVVQVRACGKINFWERID